MYNTVTYHVIQTEWVSFKLISTSLLA